MVQEFHVLRCFSCQTFQVQQVKKSKRWVCKVCGEKQSLMKEFGRGAASDCRRHVQKLNALQGRVQEISDERLESQREQDEENEKEDVDEGLDEDQLNESEQDVSRHISRWSKYTDPTDEEEEDEEENVYTERQRFRSQATRKRKKLSGLKSCADGGEDEDGCSGIKRPYQPLRPDSRFGSGRSEGSASDAVDPCRASGFPSSRQASCRVPGLSVESSGNRPQCDSSHELMAVGGARQSPAASSRQMLEEPKSEKDSKWEKFLPVVPTQQDEDEFDYQADPLSSPSYKPSGLENTVCERPPLAKPTLSFSPLFFTDEDFDDTF